MQLCESPGDGRRYKSLAASHLLDDSGRLDELLLRRLQQEPLPVGLLAVEPVLDGEAKPAGEELGDLGPAVPENQLRLVKDIVLDLAPLPLLDCGVEVVEPALRGERSDELVLD